MLQWSAVLKPVAPPFTVWLAVELPKDRRVVVGRIAIPIPSLSVTRSESAVNLFTVWNPIWRVGAVNLSIDRVNQHIGQSV